MCVCKNFGSVGFIALSRSSFLRIQNFYVYANRAPAMQGSAEEAPGKCFGTGGGSIQWVAERRCGPYISSGSHAKRREDIASESDAQAANSRGKLALGHQQAVSRPCPTCFRVAHLQRENRPSKRLRSAGAASAAEESRLCQPQEAKAASQLAGDFSGCRAEAPLPCIFRRGTGNPPSRVQTPSEQAPEGRGGTAKPGATTEPAARQKNACVPR